MPIINKIGLGRKIALIIVCSGLLSLGFTSFSDSKLSLEAQKSTEVSGEVIWHVKAIHPEGLFLDVKALDEDGHNYDVQAIQDADQTTLMDIKVLMNGKRIPVKILQSDGRFMPVKAITKDGQILDIKAFNLKGEKLDVKGIVIQEMSSILKPLQRIRNFMGSKPFLQRVN